MAEDANTSPEVRARQCACGAPARPPGKRGPIPNDCEACCRARRACRSPDQVAKDKARYLAAGHRSRKEAAAARSAQAAAARTHRCSHCSQTFVALRTSHSGLYCSRACAIKNRRARPKQPKQPKPKRHCAGCGIALSLRQRRFCLTCRRARDRAVSLAYYRRSRGNPCCQDCGAAIPNDGSYARRCNECRLSRVRASKRASKAKRKAAKRSVHAERFDPLEVLRRDGWRCHLCGRKTPERLRGTCANNAPELDHIIPIAKGGVHTRRNTACACRACNGAKSDSVVGQQRLFG